MREEKFKMERQGLIQVGDKVKISEFLSATNYSYIIEPASSHVWLLQKRRPHQIQRGHHQKH